MMYYGYGPMGYWGGGIFEFVWWVIAVIIIVSVIRWAFGHRRGHWHGRRGMWESNSALDILNERYAKGEINKTEYEEKKKDLQS